MIKWDNMWKVPRTIFSTQLVLNKHSLAEWTQIIAVWSWPSYLSIPILKKVIIIIIRLLQSGAFQTVGNTEFWHIFNWAQQYLNVSHVKYYFYGFVYARLDWNTFGWGLRSKKLKWGMCSETYSQIVRKTLYIYVIYVHV